jgi:undecaprenyl-diphosphatase
MKAAENKEEVKIGFIKALQIGFFQCIAMIPGVSRSAATIIGGVAQGLNKKQAAEFSFFLAVPTMFAATCKKLYDFYEQGISISQDQWLVLLIGNVVAFAVAILAIKSFIQYLSTHGFKIFGYYRIALGLIILLLHAFGYQLRIF